MTHYDDPRHLIAALTALRKLDLDKLFASGIGITIHDYSYEDREHMPRVDVAGEHFGPVRDALIDCLKIQIDRRVQTLQSQIRDLQAVRS